MSRKPNICQSHYIGSMKCWNSSLHCHYTYSAPRKPKFPTHRQAGRQSNRRVVSWFIEVVGKFIRVLVRSRAQFINFLFIKYLTTWGYLLAILFLYFICILWTWSFVFWILRYFIRFVTISFPFRGNNISLKQWWTCIIDLLLN